MASNHSEGSDLFQEALNIATSEGRKIRTQAMRRFCKVYWRLKWDAVDSGDQDHLPIRKNADFYANRFSLSHLTWKIRRLGLSQATAYDYAHAIRFFEAMSTLDSRTGSAGTPNPIISKIDDKAFMLSPGSASKLRHILFRKRCTVSEFLDEAIAREFTILSKKTS